MPRDLCGIVATLRFVDGEEDEDDIDAEEVYARAAVARAYEVQRERKARHLTRWSKQQRRYNGR